MANAITDLVNSALAAAGDLAEGATDAATDALKKAKAGYVDPLMAQAQVYYDYCISKGMPPEEAMDATERMLRDVTGRLII